MNQQTNIPDPAPEIVARLAVDYAELESTIASYDATASDLPPEIGDEDERHQFAEILTRMQKTAKSIEGARNAEKAIYLASERAVDGYFYKLRDRLKEVVDDLNGCLTRYLRKLQDQENARRAAEAAEARRVAEEKRKEEEAAREAARVAETAAARRQAEQEASIAAQQATRAEQLVETRAAPVKAADAVRGRSATGKLSTLRTTWEGEILDLDYLDVRRLLPFITRPHLEAALRAYVRAGHRELSGARIFEVTNAQTRG